MEVIELPVESLKEASWNANQIDEAMLQRLRSSILKYGFIQNLVVRQVAGGYEVLSGNQRLKLLREFNISKVPCVIVDLDDAHARLLAQVLSKNSSIALSPSSFPKTFRPSNLNRSCLT